jgi:hypothetical protein
MNWSKILRMNIAAISFTSLAAVAVPTSANGGTDAEAPSVEDVDRDAYSMPERQTCGGTGCAASGAGCSSLCGTQCRCSLDSSSGNGCSSDLPIRFKCYD